MALFCILFDVIISNVTELFKNFLFKNKISVDLRLVNQLKRIVNFDDFFEFLLDVYFQSLLFFILIKESDQKFLNHVDNNHEVVEVNLSEETCLSVDRKTQNEQDVLYCLNFIPVHILDEKVWNHELCGVSEYETDNRKDCRVNPEALFPCVLKLQHFVKDVACELLQISDCLAVVLNS